MAKIIRKEPRRHLVYYLQVVDPADGHKVGRLVDVTPVGMMMISTEAMETGKAVALRLLLPEEMEGPDTVELNGQVVWCHKDVNPDYFASGIQFTDISEPARFAIRDLIDALAFQH